MSWVAKLRYVIERVVVTEGGIAMVTMGYIFKESDNI